MGKKGTRTKAQGGCRRRERRGETGAGKVLRHILESVRLFLLRKPSFFLCALCGQCPRLKVHDDGQCENLGPIYPKKRRLSCAGRLQKRQTEAPLSIGWRETIDADEVDSIAHFLEARQRPRCLRGAIALSASMPGVRLQVRLRETNPRCFNFLPRGKELKSASGTSITLSVPSILLRKVAFVACIYLLLNS